MAMGPETNEERIKWDLDLAFSTRPSPPPNFLLDKD